MPALELSPAAQHWVNAVLLWIGFGTLAGLAARALLPGRDPVGTIGTVTIGVLGSVIGPLALSHLLGQANFNPISPLGLLTAIGASFVVLAIYRVWRALIGANTLDDDDLDDEPR